MAVKAKILGKQKANNSLFVIVEYSDGQEKLVQNIEILPGQSVESLKNTINDKTANIEQMFAAYKNIVAAVVPEPTKATPTPEELEEIQIKNDISNYRKGQKMVDAGLFTEEELK